jgi:hypothetical protein
LDGTRVPVKHRDGVALRCGLMSARGTSSDEPSPADGPPSGRGFPQSMLMARTTLEV